VVSQCVTSLEPWVVSGSAVFFESCLRRTGPQALRGYKLRKMAGMAHQIDVFFEISRRGSTIGTELRAGATSFLTLRFGLTIHAGQVCTRDRSVIHELRKVFTIKCSKPAGILVSYACIRRTINFSCCSQEMPPAQSAQTKA
jgi:hypothetical protein